MAISFVLGLSTQVCELLFHLNFYTAILDMGLSSYISTASTYSMLFSTSLHVLLLRHVFSEKVKILQYVHVETLKVTSKG